MLSDFTVCVKFFFAFKFQLSSKCKCCRFHFHSINKLHPLCFQINYFIIFVKVFHLHHFCLSLREIKRFQMVLKAFLEAFQRRTKDGVKAPVLNVKEKTDEHRIVTQLCVFLKLDIQVREQTIDHNPNYFYLGTCVDVVLCELQINI